MSNNLELQDKITYEPVFVARQPIFDRDNSIWGYELLFRHSAEAGTAQVTDQNEATAKVIIDGFTIASDRSAPESRFLINFPQRLLLDDSAYALPKERAIIEILEHVDATPEVVENLKKLKEYGYTLALDDFVGQGGFEEVLKLTDLIKVEVLGMAQPELIKLTQSLKKHRVKLLAEKVEDKAMFSLCKALGYDYFQGYFFSKPEVVPGRKLPAGAMARFQLLKELSRDDYEVKELAKIIESDLSLSYRLLRFINSAAFSLPKGVDSIQQAIALIGGRPLKQWLTVVMLSDMNTSPMAQEMTYSSVQRARYLEVLTEIMKRSGYERSTMFMLGLFSKLDALFGMPMDEIVGPMALSDEIKNALMGQESPARQWIELVDHLDAGDFDATGRILKANDINPMEAALKHVEASNWAYQVLGLTKEQEGDAG